MVMDNRHHWETCSYVVSPTVVAESPEYFPFFPGVTPVSMEAVTAAYVKSVLGAQTGQSYKIW